MSEFRVGYGYDVHAFAVGRDLKIGGVKIDFEKGLAGHSDADVLLHAICDALLGAAGLGDIGQHFPPGDPKYKDIDSIKLLKQVHQKIKAAGCDEIANIDSTVLAEKPHLQKYYSLMKEKIGQALSMDVSRINIKATTAEGLGFVGRQEGMAATAVCIIRKA
jgi:2-C-methyl-D-erythritol 2,4-cyclodiphosphate synthase